jgi:hypothetical protein
LTFSHGAVDAKRKLLIVMAVNVITGVGYVCSEIVKLLRDMKVKKEEIVEALCVAATVGAIQGVVTGAEAYAE